jgi:hypothetical protein
MKSTSTTIRALALAIFAASLVGDLGCTKMTKPSKMFSLDSTWPFRDKDAPHEGTPTRMACTWTDTVKTEAGKKPERGFGGRIVFYEKDEKNPILVEGELVVYAFDETDRDPTDTKPTRRYVFPADQIPLHMSKNEFGATYSFYLPWDEAGGPKTEVSLICRFSPNDGGVIASEQTRHMLPGAMRTVAGDGKNKPPKLPEGVPMKPVQQTLQTLRQKRNDEHNAQLASYETPAIADSQAVAPGAAANSTTPERKMTSTTINLPGNFQMPTAAQVMMQPPAAAPAMPSAPIMPQLPATMFQQPVAQPLPQQAVAVSPQSAAAIPTVAQAVQQMALNRPFTGGQPMVPNSAVMSPAVHGQPGTIPAGGIQPGQSILAPNTVAPGAVQTMPAITGASVSSNPNAMAQLQAQQLALQQQLMQQQLMQQKALQQRPLPQSPVPQIPVQAGVSTLSYPPAGQSLR